MWYKLRGYGYLGLLLIALGEINFWAVIQPFALWYIPIMWYGYILFVDSLVYKVGKKSLISSYPKELVLMIFLSVPFWLIFEVYNIFTGSWHYTNYIWYVHLLDFTTIMPAVLETFSLYNVLEIGKGLDRKRKAISSGISRTSYIFVLIVLIAFGAFVSFLPILEPEIGFPFMWVGLFLLFDPLNQLLGRPSLVQKVSNGKKSQMARVFLAGITMGFFWEFWNYQAYPRWTYTIPYLLSSIKLFEMPVLGYLGYLPFAAEVFLFYAFFRAYIFKNRNDLISM